MSKKHCPSSGCGEPTNSALDTNCLPLTNESRGCWPQDVGIIAMEVYFPSQFVDQSELELFDGASQGKYTIGLGQNRMGFCSDREDINSLCLTVLTRLVERTGIGYRSIGRLEVGTETIIDKSKSVKSALMTVLAVAGNTDVEGVDTTNACYGGTAALLNSVNWVESSAWDGRYAVAVAGDIAVYATGAARPTGGAGAVAMLVGPHAPLVIDAGVRSSHMNHSYDFYKPDLSSEYPIVDGKLSIQCYFSALDACYNGYLRKAGHLLGVSDLDSVDAMLFHTPYCKLVQKSLARLAFNDFLNASSEEASQKFPGLEAFRSKTLEGTFFDRDVEKAFMAASLEAFKSKTKPSLQLASQVGNMYTPSLYGGLASLLASYASAPLDLLGKRLCLFSYGSGLASTMFSITVKKGRPPLPPAATAADTVAPVNAPSNSSGLEELIASLSSLTERLSSRSKVSPQQFADAMMVREKTHHLAPYSPSGPVSALAPGTWFLETIDDKHRRHYGRQPPVSTSNDADNPASVATAEDSVMLSPKKAAAVPDVVATVAVAATATSSPLLNGQVDV